MHPDLEVELPFDINLKDVSGQTALYIACQMGNQKLVDILLHNKVQGRPKDGNVNVKCPTPKTEQPPPETPTSPVSEAGSGSPGKKRVISEGIQGILSKLSLATKQNLTAAAPKVDYTD
jgi:ankyrin repeat protein